MQGMTIKEARKILGKLGDRMNDNDILVEIESATLLKNIFFSIYCNKGDKKTTLHSLLSKAVQ